MFLRRDRCASSAAHGERALHQISNSSGSQIQPECEFHKLLYDRAASLGRLGAWECELATERLTWTDGVYDLFDLPRGSKVGRKQILNLYDDDSRSTVEQLRKRAISHGEGFCTDIRIRTPEGRLRTLRLTAAVSAEEGRPARLYGLKQQIS